MNHEGMLQGFGKFCFTPQVSVDGRMGVSAARAECVGAEKRDRTRTRTRTHPCTHFVMSRFGACSNIRMLSCFSAGSCASVQIAPGNEWQNWSYNAAYEGKDFTANCQIHNPEIGTGRYLA